MIMLTEADVRTYCIGMAQIIPVFLIALFVAEGSRPAKYLEKLVKELSELEGKGRQFLPKAEKANRRIEKRLEELDEQISALDIIDPSQASEDALSALEELRKDLVSERLEKANASAELTRQSDAAKQSIERSATKTEERNASVLWIKKNHSYTILAGILFGMGGEVIALWGAIGLVAGLYAVAWVTTIAILVMGILANFATECFTVEFHDSKWSKLISYVPFTAACFTAAATFYWIFFNVRIVS